MWRRRGELESAGLGISSPSAFRAELHESVEKTRVLNSRNMGSKSRKRIKVQGDSAFLRQVCLSEAARLSIILATPQHQPWYLLPVTQVLNRRRKTVGFSTSGCLNIDFHFEIPRSTE
jgi:hypothetical protein